MSIEKDGKYAENIARLLLKEHDFSNIFQVDWIAKGRDGKWYLFEVKNQDAFEPPPFKGHGLPRWQIDSRLRFQEETGVIAIFLVLDKTQKIWYYQRLDLLEQGEKVDTNGSQPRRIYNINSFHTMESRNC